jgi:hypothetical protein
LGFRCAALALLCLLAPPRARALPFSDRITLPSGEKIFLAGFNLAWIQFASDVGDAPLNATAFRAALKAVSDSGGNVMRVWLSTNGWKDPVFGSDGLVTGLGPQTLANVQQMLAIAKENRMLLMPVLLTHNFMQKQTGVNLDNNRKLLATDAGLKAYIDHALLPLVTAIGKDPNLVCWEIANEPEGMVEGIGWTDSRIPKSAVQVFTNRMAGAIHRAVPGVLVSTGTVQASYLNWYTDAALKAAGGDSDGVLDFYQVHYYGWNGPSNSPFRKGAAAWGLDKPIVVGEFASSSWGPGTLSSSAMQDAESIDTLLENLFKNGYAGGQFWQYQPDAGDTWMKGFATASPTLAKFARAHAAEVAFDGVSDNKLAVVVSASAGGTAIASPTGRVANGTLVTVTATAAAGYEFTGWGGDTAADAAVNPIKIKVVKDRSLLAHFRPAPGTNLLKNGDFASIAAWEFSTSASGTAKGTVSYAAGQADIQITAAGAKDWHLQLQQGGFPLPTGATLVVSFDAWADADRDVNVGLTTTSWVWQGGAGVGVTTLKRNYQVELRATDSLPAGAIGVLQFNVGEKISTLHIDNVVLSMKSGSPIRGRFADRAMPMLRLSASSGSLAWTTKYPLAAPAELVVRDFRGREIGRYSLPAGISSGVIPARLSQGRLTAELDPDSQSMPRPE